MKYYGIKKPRIESNESAMAYLAEAEIKPDILMHIDSVASHYFYTTRTFTCDLEVYNSEGALIRRVAENECSAKVAESLESLDLDSMKPALINTKHLDEALAPYETSEGRKLTTKDFGKGNYIACITYAVYAGNLYKETLKYMYDPLTKNADRDRITIIFLNVDMHESWGIKRRNDDRRIKLN